MPAPDPGGGPAPSTSPARRPDGARAFARDTSRAEIRLLDGGHFLPEAAGDETTCLILDFLGRQAA